MNFGIIAAGDGSRLVHEGIATPKPLIDIDGRPMIGRLIDIFMQCGAETISVIVNEYMTEVADYLHRLQATVAPCLRIVVKTTPSSMHSFYHLTRGIDSGRIILTTVDTVFRPDDFRRYVEAFDRRGDIDGLMAVTTYIDDEKPLYVRTVDDMRITAFEDASFEGVRYISGGIYGLDSRAVGLLSDCVDRGVSRMRNFQRALVDAGLDIRAYDFGKILDVDHAGDIDKARAFLRQ